MKDSTDNVAYLPHAARDQDATQPAKDIGPLSDDEQQLVDKYLRLSRQQRTIVQRTMMRLLNSDEYKQQ